MTTARSDPSLKGRLAASSRIFTFEQKKTSDVIRLGMNVSRNPAPEPISRTGSVPRGSAWANVLYHSSYIFRRKGFSLMMRRLNQVVTGSSMSSEFVRGCASSRFNIVPTLFHEGFAASPLLASRKIACLKSEESSSEEVRYHLRKRVGQLHEFQIISNLAC